MKNEQLTISQIRKKHSDLKQEFHICEIKKSFCNNIDVKKYEKQGKIIQGKIVKLKKQFDQKMKEGRSVGEIEKSLQIAISWVKFYEVLLNNEFQLEADAKTELIKWKNQVVLLKVELENAKKRDKNTKIIKQ